MHRAPRAPPKGTASTTFGGRAGFAISRYRETAKFRALLEYAAREWELCVFACYRATSEVIDDDVFCPLLPL